MSFGVAMRNSVSLGLGGIPSLASGSRGNSPTLNLNFTSGILDPRVTFTRSTTATFTGSNGLIQSAAINQARFDYNPITLQPLGLLIEEQRSNLATYSEQFDNAAWAKTGLTVTANATVSPDGTSNADFYDDGTLNTTHYLALISSIAVNTTYAVSVFAKKNDLNFINVGITDIAVGNRFSVASFNINTGAVSASFASGTGYSVVSTNISSVGNGWYRCVIVATVGSTAVAPRFVIASSNDGTVPAAGGGFKAYLGANNKTYIWGAQLEAGTFATSYIPTVASQVTRSADNAVITGTNFSSWYNASEGTMYAKYIIPALPVSGVPRVFSLLGSPGVNNNEILLFVSQSSGKASSANVFTSGVIVGRIDTTANYVANATTESILGYSLNFRAITSNGVAPTTSTATFTMPTLTSASIGSASSIAHLNGTIAQISYYPQRLPNSQLQALTT